MLFVLVHSPSVGPATWSAVAARLAGTGHTAVVPSLLTVGEGGPPFWPRVTAAVGDGLAGTDPAEPLVLVAHSNAGVFVPVIRCSLARPVACSIFVDASLPSQPGPTPMVGEEFLPFLRGLAAPDGRLPRWTDWWDEPDVAALFPDPATREAIASEQPRLPLAYYEEQVPVPDGWQDHRCAYLLFGPPYDAQAGEARQRGFQVRSLPGEHLHQLVDPGGVARSLLSLAESSAPLS
jgi:hypothetical protein